MLDATIKSFSLWSIDTVTIEFLKLQSVWIPSCQQAYIWAHCPMKYSQGNVNAFVKLSLIKLGRLCLLPNFCTKDIGRFLADRQL